jgi:SAM-dependent methyltransferase
MLPNDETEQDRLDFLHHALLRVTGLLTHVSHPTDARVLDLGCGTGIWVIEFAETFPNSFVVGVDLSSIQPARHPHNCHFYAPFDFEFPWKKLGEESWDVIRLQVCGGSVVNWPSLYRRVIAHLRPDAWFEQVDIDFEPKCEDRTVGGSALYNWYCKLSQATSDAARPISHQFQATIDHLRNAGFTDVEHKQFILPLNKWHPDSRMRNIGRWYGRAFFESIEPLSLAPFCRILGWTPGEVRHLVSDAKSELLDPAVHTFHVLHIYTARKDTPSSGCAGPESDR